MQAPGTITITRRRAWRIYFDAYRACRHGNIASAALALYRVPEARRHHTVKLGCPRRVGDHVEVLVEIT